MLTRSLAFVVVFASATAFADDSPCLPDTFSSATGLALGSVGAAAPFVLVQQGTAAGCPDAKKPECNTRAKLKAGAAVVLGETVRGTRCVWFQPRGGKPVVGWVDEAAITPQPEVAPPVETWVGTYAGGKAVITLTRDGDKIAAVGKLKQPAVKGEARGATFAGAGTPIGATVSLQSGECAVRLVLLNDVLFADDNAKCGSPGARFMGGFPRKGK